MTAITLFNVGNKKRDLSIRWYASFNRTIDSQDLLLGTSETFTLEPFSTYRYVDNLQVSWIGRRYIIATWSPGDCFINNGNAIPVGIVISY